MNSPSQPNSDPVPLSFDEPWRYELGFPCDPRGPRIARTTMRAVLMAHGLTELTYRAELLASELTTNSVRYTKGRITLRLHWLCPVLRVSVRDLSPDLPELRRPRPRDGDEKGRGLVLLDLVADRWGGCAMGEGAHEPGGKTIWFELALDSEGVAPGAVIAQPVPVPVPVPVAGGK
ncbi:ATP-binding protein [Streptomyces sp. NPDC057963]|uniref:ATP-binding protein n=1 Tax=Streptomyces sp. NPDC057963 TaxID=3346290 RepID=UPI0036EA8CB5